jgi:hypothetical protein
MPRHFVAMLQGSTELRRTANKMRWSSDHLFSDNFGMVFFLPF